MMVTSTADAAAPPADVTTASADAATTTSVYVADPPTDAATTTTTADAASAPARLYGVTVDDVSNLSGVVDALRGLPRRATARIVFDEGQAPRAYAAAVPAVHAVADVMGEILDSEFVARTPVDAYLARTSAYLAAFAGQVDIWEVANEINGNWLDTSAGGAADVVAKMSGAFDLVRAAGGRTALTLYGCSDAGASHDMLVWSRANVPERMRTGLDYVLVSFYEGDCGAAAPDWPAVFHQLRVIFPTAALGFGEVGAVTRAGNRVTDPALASPYLRRYYGMTITEPGYIGGYFWWYFAEDMVPSTQPLYSVLSDAIR